MQLLARQENDVAGSNRRTRRLGPQVAFALEDHDRFLVQVPVRGRPGARELADELGNFGRAVLLTVQHLVETIRHGFAQRRVDAEYAFGQVGAEVVRHRVQPVRRLAAGTHRQQQGPWCTARVPNPESLALAHVDSAFRTRRKGATGNGNVYLPRGQEEHGVAAGESQHVGQARLGDHVPLRQEPGAVRGTDHRAQPDRTARRQRPGVDRPDITPAVEHRFADTTLAARRQRYLRRGTDFVGCRLLVLVAQRIVGAIAVGLPAGALAAAQQGFAVRVRNELHRLEPGTGMGAVAKGLPLTAAAGAPGVSPTSFELDQVRLAAGYHGVGHLDSLSRAAVPQMCILGIRRRRVQSQIRVAALSWP